VLAVEDDADFLERNIGCLGVCEVDYDNVDGDEDIGNNVVLPSEVLQCDWVGVVLLLSS